MVSGRKTGINHCIPFIEGVYVESGIYPMVFQGKIMDNCLSVGSKITSIFCPQNVQSFWDFRVG